MQSPEKCSLGLVNMSHFNSVVCGPKFTQFFGPTWKGLWFTFSRLKFFWGTPLSVPVCAGKPWSICSVSHVTVNVKYFPTFDMMMRSEDIRNQSRKLSNNAPNFGHFFRPHKFQGAGLPKIVPALSPLPCGTSTGKSFMRILPLDPELLWLIR